MSGREVTPLKSRIKLIAKEKGKRLADLLEVLDISRVAFDKAINSKHIKLIQLEKIASYLGVSICQLLPDCDGKENYTAIGDNSQVYKNRLDGNFFSGKDESSVKLQMENEFLKETVKKQEKEIEFLRGLIEKGK